jgi:hypothetical protein
LATSATQDAVRRTVLADMQIDVWVLRGARQPQAHEAAHGAAHGAAHENAQGGAQRGAQREAIATAQEVPLATGSKSPVGAPTPAVSSVPDAEARASAPVKLAVLCLASAEVLMLVEDSGRDRRRLVQDIFFAASGALREGREASTSNSAGNRELAFAWDGDEQSQWRALGAFVDKQVADYTPRFILCSAGLFSHLPDRVADIPVIQMPPLAELGKRVDLKRELWQQIQSLRT